jgi:hypothetical protein
MAVTVIKAEQLWADFDPTIRAKRATRTGSASACRMASTVTFSIDGWKRGLTVSF